VSLSNSLTFESRELTYDKSADINLSFHVHLHLSVSLSVHHECESVTQ